MQRNSGRFGGGGGGGVLETSPAKSARLRIFITADF